MTSTSVSLTLPSGYCPYAPPPPTFGLSPAWGAAGGLGSFWLWDTLGGDEGFGGSQQGGLGGQTPGFSSFGEGEKILDTWVLFQLRVLEEGGAGSLDT